MRKEVIIGLTVILALTITFGVVLARRLGDSPDTASASAATQRHDDDSDAAANVPEKAHGGAKSPSDLANSAELRILTAKPATGEPQRFSSAAGDPFPASHRDAKEPAASARAVDLPPAPMMPKPSASTWAGANDHRADDVQQTAGSRPSPLRSADTTRAPAGQPYDPFPSPLSPAATAYAGQTNYTPTGFRTPDASAPERHRAAPGYGYSDAAGYSDTAGYSGASGYAATGAVAQESPAAWRQESSSGYPPIASQQAPIPSRTGAGRDLGSPYDVRNARNANGDYEVQPNDNYWAISQKLYGSGAYFKALAEHNREKFPQEDRLDVGDVISAPSILELEKAYPDLCPKPNRRETVRSRGSLVSTPAVYGRRTYVVEEGDTLFDIARYELGKASRWVEILDLNRDLVGDDPGYIVPGMTLALPGDVEPTDRLTQRPGTTVGPYGQETVPRYR